ncbi:MAG TPA: SDR family oxidoreductase [Baekduia sp.]|jgi:NAD(P)-dependent dehydrogenase (short-subunit alcohol dehydrogenase family)
MSADLDYLGGLFGLEGRTALVTGARQGVGREIALGLARAGASVAVTGRDGASLAELGAELEALGARHLELALDVADPAQVDACVAAVVGEWGRIDIAINNAGLSIRRPAADYDVAEWDAVIHTNLRGPFLVARAAAAHMDDGGRIVNLSSTFAHTAAAERAPYAAGKAGLEHLTRVLAIEWAARGILVTGVAPGATPTETRRGVLDDPAVVEQRVKQIPLGRLGRADDVVGAVLLLVSDAGRFITGQTIVVDGGYTLGAGS